MDCEIHNRGNLSVIYLAGQFVFGDHVVFRTTYKQALAHRETQIIQLDLSKVDYLDSSALGMMLLLKEKAEALGKQVRISRARGVVQQVLDVANFQKSFEITA